LDIVQPGAALGSDWTGSSICAAVTHFVLFIAGIDMPGISICTVASQFPGRIGLWAMTTDTARAHASAAIRIDFMTAPSGHTE
jgi:hypothetical protein